MNTLSLSELTALLRATLSRALPGTYWVRAEIASMSVRGGHCYMDLVEKADDGILAAKVRATCWSHLYAMLSAYFAEQTGSSLHAGMQVLVEVEVSFHAVYGLSLNIVQIDPRYTLGDLARQRQQVLDRLASEGALDRQQLLSMPLLPARIAVISSDQAAGYEDFVHQIRASHYAITCTLFPAIMQGDKAEASMLEALQQVSAETSRFDAAVIIRGGGASADLSCFDSYALCAACALLPIPVLTGIGHTRDVSVLDMVAYQALKTPTAVAAYLTECFETQYQRLLSLRQRLSRTTEIQQMMRLHRIQVFRQRLEQADKRQRMVCLHHIASLRQVLQANNPEHIYRKGYSLMTVDGQVVRSTRALHAGQVVETHLMDGIVTSQVLKNS